MSTALEHVWDVLIVSDESRTKSSLLYRLKDAIGMFPDWSGLSETFTIPFILRYLEKSAVRLIKSKVQLCHGRPYLNYNENLFESFTSLEMRSMFDDKVDSSQQKEKAKV